MSYFTVDLNYASNYPAAFFTLKTFASFKNENKFKLLFVKSYQVKSTVRVQ